MPAPRFASWARPGEWREGRENGGGSRDGREGGWWEVEEGGGAAAIRGHRSARLGAAGGMQSVINTVKGKALEVAEYLTPVLKVL